MSGSYAESIPRAPSAFAAVHAFAAETEKTITSPGMLRAEHSEAETFVEQSGREWARLLFEAHCALRAEREEAVRVVGSDGAERTSTRDSERHVETLVGNVAVPRLAHQEPGHLDLHPLDAQLNLPTTDSFSHGVRRFVATAREQTLRRSPSFRVGARFADVHDAPVMSDEIRPDAESLPRVASRRVCPRPGRSAT